MELQCKQVKKLKVPAGNFYLLTHSNRTGNTLYVYGMIRDLQGRTDESYKFHQRALDFFKEALGKLHPQTSKAFLKVADHCIRFNQYELAM
jgi:hypothetical protein